MTEAVKRFPYLEFDNVNREIRYLGYVLKLTDCEYEVLKALVLADKPLDKYEIKRFNDADADAKTKISAGSVPVHVCAVNQKSVLLGGRKIITVKRKIGYSVNEFM